MFESSLRDLALRRAWNHRTHRSRMSSTSLRTMLSSSLIYAELRSCCPCWFVSSVLAEADLIVVPNTSFEFADEDPEKAYHDGLVNLSRFFVGHLHGRSIAAAVGFCA